MCAAPGFRALQRVAEGVLGVELRGVVAMQGRTLGRVFEPGSAPIAQEQGEVILYTFLEVMLSS